ncbi:MAG: (d)CMP kinase [Gammaproteobacteria bacterium]|nr:(d)CMP kinase [Gammaproteobacteria bacterium]
MTFPVITIDGTSGVGKGTISSMLASHLQWHYLDSGALYRITAYTALKKGIDLANEQAITDLANSLSISFLASGEILVDKYDISSAIRTEQVGMSASKVATYPKLRKALFNKQRSFLKAPGLVADGRDMGTTIFPDAKLKIFLTASAEERGKRRYKQLKDKETHAIMPSSNLLQKNDLDLSDIIRKIEQRDHQDMNRASSPLKPADDAVIIDTTLLTINDVFNQVLTLLNKSE